MIAAALLLLPLSATPMPAEDRPMTKQVSDYLATEKWPEVFQTVEIWSRLSKDERARLVELLAPALTDRSRVALRDTQDLIIPYRLDTGDLKFQGHGLVVRQDLFTTGGRAAWAISRLLEIDLPELNEGLTKAQWAERAADIAARAKSPQAPDKPK